MINNINQLDVQTHGQGQVGRPGLQGRAERGRYSGDMRYTYIYIYIYMFRERERDIEREIVR